MLTPRIAALLTLLLASSSLGQRARRPPRPPSPISTIQPKANFDAQQFAGTWLLVAVASPCRHLQEQGHRAEATTLHVAPQGSAMTVSTFRKLDGICWAVRQLYGDTGRPGRFLLQGEAVAAGGGHSADVGLTHRLPTARGARGPVDVVVGDTDYRGFAVLYLERARQLSVKLYVRSLPVGDSFLSAFEQRVQGANLTEDHTLFFPKYGFCEAADQFHTLDGNTHTVADRSLLSPFTATFTLNKNNRLEVAYAMFRGQRCITWSYELISQSQPGVFSVDHSGGRIWAIQTQLLDKFVCLVRAQGLSDDNIIFPDLTGGLLLRLGSARGLGALWGPAGARPTLGAQV
ncbi:hypothetical protein MJG53_005563 [Ovis ammon polii x Ovis aries]|uniref:Uncharacterized protein n=1 Tax=Ovis ammon polii x Ovis aries TaxID=2918886 RepID=A0ACB9VCT4_9CETA|nr:hypothetical protein MJG53_005563 [Ovis ammon polii x Ovis aries]